VPFYPQAIPSESGDPDEWIDSDLGEDQDADDIDIPVPHQIKGVIRRPNAKSPLPPLTAPLSAHEKNVLLQDRERRWETLDYAHKRVVKVGGRAGVYELQEGIFLMCDEFSDMDDSKVSIAERRRAVILI
jgi:hypothetical protein